MIEVGGRWRAVERPGRLHGVLDVDPHPLGAAGFASASTAPLRRAGFGSRCRLQLQAHSGAPRVRGAWRFSATKAACDTWDVSAGPPSTRPRWPQRCRRRSHRPKSRVARASSARPRSPGAFGAVDATGRRPRPCRRIAVSTAASACSTPAGQDSAIERQSRPTSPIGVMASIALPTSPPAVRRPARRWWRRPATVAVAHVVISTTKTIWLKVVARAGTSSPQRPATGGRRAQESSAVQFANAGLRHATAGRRRRHRTRLQACTSARHVHINSDASRRGSHARLGRGDAVDGSPAESRWRLRSAPTAPRRPLRVAAGPAGVYCWTSANGWSPPGPRTSLTADRLRGRRHRRGRRRPVEARPSCAGPRRANGWKPVGRLERSTGACAAVEVFELLERPRAAAGR